MYKIVYLHKRRAEHELGAFHERLLALADSDPWFPGMTHYVQSHTLTQGYRRGELVADAVEEFGFETAATAQLVRSSAQFGDTMARRDHLINTAAGHCLTVVVYRIKSHPVPAGSIKSIELVTRRPSVPWPVFKHHWLTTHGPIASRIPTLLRYEQNHTALSEYVDGSTPTLDGLAITWFASTDAMRAGTATEAYRSTRADEPNFLADGHLPTILVRDVIER